MAAMTAAMAANAVATSDSIARGTLVPCGFARYP